jgi:hypothetical protein
MKRVVRLASKGVGLAAEAIEDHKQKKRTPAASPNRASGVSDVHPAAAGPSSHLPNHERDKEHYESDSDDSSVEDDEEAWQLDEAGLPPSYEDVIGEGTRAQGEDDRKEAFLEDETASESRRKPKIPDKVDALAARLGPPLPRIQGSHGEFIGPLPCPVVLPQRRPRSKARGFVRAYAPVLIEAGIDQDTWISFLNQWDESSKVG